MLQAITNLDLSILLEIQEHLRCGFSDVIFPVLSKLNNAGFIWIVITLVLLYIKKTRTAGLCMAVCLLVNLALGEGILKHLLNRARPFVVHPISQMLIALPTTSSFPSGHTSSSFAAATALLRNHKRAGMAAYVLAGLISFSRLYLYLHYPTDVLGGILLGSCVGWFVTPWVWKKLKKLKKLPIKRFRI